MKNIGRTVLEALGILKPFKIQSFTYYIPSPPDRRSGYREKQFDKVFYEFINRGYKVLDTKTQSNTGQPGSGMWVMFTVQATNKEAEKLDLNSFFNDQVAPDLENFQEDKVEGIYQVNS